MIMQEDLLTRSPYRRSVGGPLHMYIMNVYGGDRFKSTVLK